jgi:hypothetical protein
MMAEAPTWEVDLFVDGPITLDRRYRTTQQKGFRPENPFYSDVEVAGIPSGGLRATVTARAPNERLAFDAAVVFFGRMLDALAFEVDLPLFLSLTEEGSRNSRVRHHSRQIIGHQQIENAFRAADDLGMTEPAFLRSLGWYRKGLYTEDPLDKFLAFWNAIEIVTAGYYGTVESIDQERAKKGSKNQVWGCFIALWGECERWPNIPGDNRWIDENYETRTKIAHGISPVDIETVTSVINRLDVIQRVAHRFLWDWREDILHAGWDPASQSAPNSDDEALPF